MPRYNMLEKYNIGEMIVDAQLIPENHSLINIHKLLHDKNFDEFPEYRTCSTPNQSKLIDLRNYKESDLEGVDFNTSGFVFQNDEKTEMLQTRVDRFTHTSACGFNKMIDSLKKAVDFWDKYKEAMKPGYAFEYSVRYVKNFPVSKAQYEANEVYKTRICFSHSEIKQVIDNSFSYTLKSDNGIMLVECYMNSKEEKYMATINLTALFPRKIKTNNIKILLYEQYKILASTVKDILSDEIYKNLVRGA
ncbi:MAG: hypothetical protein JXQ23_04450 [Clostridia bacterium]|nr:hypothetical protein [Clostridia bacterium]